jgi:hypothetical protein
MINKGVIFWQICGMSGELICSEEVVYQPSGGGREPLSDGIIEEIGQIDIYFGEESNLYYVIYNSY